MQKAVTDIRQYTQGDDIRHRWTYYANTERTATLNITAFQFRADLVVNVDSLFSKIQSLDIDTSTLTSSFVTTLISRSVTALLTPGFYSYDMTHRDADGCQFATATTQFEILPKRTDWSD